MTGPQRSLFAAFDRTGIPLIAVRLMLGGFFLYSGYNKTGLPGAAGDPITFLKMIRQYNVLPEEPAYLMNGVAIVLPYLEMLCGLTLLSGLLIRGSCLVMGGMLVPFTLAIFVRAMGIYQAGGIAFCDIKFDCGCGTGEDYICHKIPMNLGLFALAVIGLLTRSRRFTLAGLFQKADHAAAGFSTASRPEAG